MTAALIIAAALVAGLAGYAWGLLAGKSKAQHPQLCRDRLEAEQRAKETWRRRALLLEETCNQLSRDLTFTGEFLLGELDKVGGR